MSQCVQRGSPHFKILPENLSITLQIQSSDSDRGSVTERGRAERERRQETMEKHKVPDHPPGLNT